MSLNDDSRPSTPQSQAPAALSAQKADQIASRFFIKFLLILVSARSTAIEHGPRSTKVDKWFNLETPDTDIYRDHMRAFRAISSMSTPPTLIIHVVLTIPELGSNKALVALGPSDFRLKIEPTPRAILLETWTLSATPLAGVSASASLSASDPAELSLAAVYKHAISLFRSLYTLSRQLPAARLYQRYRQRVGAVTTSSAFGIELRLQLDQSVLPFDASPSSLRSAPLPTTSHAFPGLSTPLGALKISVRYLTQPNFRIDTLESLISSRLFHQDAGQLEESVAFTPTVQAHRARDSAASSPSTTGIAMRGSRQPVAVGPRHSRTISFPASGAAVSLAKGPQEQASSRSGSASDRSIHAPLAPNTSAGSSPRYGGFTPAFVTPSSLGRGAPLRPGRDSLEMPKVGGAERSSPGTSTSPPSNLSRLRPEGARLVSLPATNVPVISAFKSSTFSPAALGSPSSSLRNHTPGTPIMSRPPSSLPHTIPETSGAGASSRPWPTVISSSPVGSIGPLGEPLPFVASTSVPRGIVSPLANLSGSPHSGDSSIGSPAKPQGAKRYSSSFSHRRAPSAGVSGTVTPIEGAARRASVLPEGSPAALSGDLPSERSRPSSTVLDPTKHEDDLSEFLRAIDNVRPLRGGVNDSHSSDSASSSAVGHARRISLAERRQSPLIGRLELPPPSPRSPPARLQELNLVDRGVRDNAIVGSDNRMPMPLSSHQQDLSAKLQNMDTHFSESIRALQERRRGTTRGTGGGEGGQALAGNGNVETGTRGSPVPPRTGTPSRDKIYLPPRESTSDQVPLFTPGGESTASDGSGYAGIVGPLDLESPELRTAAMARSPLPQTYRDSTATSGERRSVDSDRSDTQGGLGISTSRPESAEPAKRTSKYTSVLRRDTTVRPISASPTAIGSSGAIPGPTSSSSTQATRRLATGWSGSEPSAP